MAVLVLVPGGIYNVSSIAIVHIAVVCALCRREQLQRLLNATVGRYCQYQQPETEPPAAQVTGNCDSHSYVGPTREETSNCYGLLNWGGPFISV